MAVKQKAEEDAQARIAAEKRAAEDREAKARADAIAEVQRRKDAELAPQQAEAAKSRQAAGQAEAERAQLRAQLLNQLNSILQTRDSARGLIVNMSDVLFDTGSYTRKPGAREKLAKSSGIVLAHPGRSLQIEAHTDSVGGDEFNQQ